jgi:ABC-type bacteriocin/lantibiotic exporter with double-glycine peptidase domain
MACRCASSGVAFRKGIGVVMQDDQLLSGSTADNIWPF